MHMHKHIEYITYMKRNAQKLFVFCAFTMGLRRITWPTRMQSAMQSIRSDSLYVPCIWVHLQFVCRKKTPTERSTKSVCVCTCIIFQFVSLLLTSIYTRIVYIPNRQFSCIFLCFIFSLLLLLLLNACVNNFFVIAISFIITIEWTCANWLSIVQMIGIFLHGLNELGQLKY